MSSWLEPPFNMIIVGMTKCGKTHYLLEMLEKEYKGYFDYIFLICPTYEGNKTYQEWKYKDDDKFFPIPCDQDQVEEYLKNITSIFSHTNSLIILDDCASGQSVKNRTSELVKLAFSARHYNLSTIVITQLLTAISKSYRVNTSKLTTFFNTSKNDMQIIFDESLNVSNEEKTNIIEKLKNNKYARLEILRTHPYTHDVICSST